jgi:hypothetical protein
VEEAGLNASSVLRGIDGENQDGEREHGLEAGWAFLTHSVADFPSPPIRRLHVSDPTINTFELETEDLHNPFTEFLA